MTVAKLDPRLIHSDADIGKATDQPDAIDVMVEKINELVDATSGTETEQASLYIASGTEGDSFAVPLPIPRTDTNYAVTMSVGIQANGAYTLAAPTFLFGLTSFRVFAGVPPTAGDTFSFKVSDLSAGSQVPAPAEGFVVIAGQSNARGQGDVSAVGAPWTSPDLAVQMYSQQAIFADPIPWVTTLGALRQYAATPPDIGVELEIGRALVTAGHNLVMGKVAVDSTSLADHWAPAATFPTSPFGGPNLFTQLVNYCAGLVTQTGLPLKGIVWIQGESDAGDAGEAAAYGANLTAFVAAFRAAAGAVPFIVVELNSLMALPFIANVQAGQVAYTSGDPNSALVSVTGLTSPSGGIHYDAADLVTLGDRCAAALLPFL